MMFHRLMPIVMAFVFLFSSTSETLYGLPARGAAKKAFSASKARPAAVKRPPAVRPAAAVKKNPALKRPDATFKAKLDPTTPPNKKTSIADQADAFKKNKNSSITDQADAFKKAKSPQTESSGSSRQLSAKSGINPADVMGRPKYDELLAQKKKNLDNPTAATKLPLPETYLPQAYIQDHNAKFDQGASRFVTKGALNKYGPAQRDGTSFVIPAKDADKMIEEANGDKVAMEKKLGLPEGTLSKDDLVRIDVPEPRKAGLRIPSGNEAGANSQWLPGGKLPGGGVEAVLDLGKGSEDKWTSTDLFK